MYKCDNYDLGILDETKVKPNRYIGFGCKDYESIPHYIMRDCEGYYFNGKVFYAKGG